MQVERYIAVADLGSSTLALSVARVEGDDVQIIYYSQTPSDGVRYSLVFNPVRAAKPLKEAIQKAEKELNIKILQLVIGLPRYNVRQEVASARMERTDASSCITKEEIDTLKSIAIDSYPMDENAKEEIYGAVAQSFSADEDLVCASENDVIGVTSESIEGNFKIFIGKSSAVDNLDIMLNKAGVAPARKLFLPTATGRAVLTEAEKENGVALVEIGAAVTSLTIYKGGLLRHYSSIRFGGGSITSDIKFECGFTERLAENIKLAFGACMPDKLQSLSEKIIQINDDENGSYEQLPVKYLSEIITCRAREIINAILFQIQESGYADSLRNGLVLTGGGAELVNFANMFKEMSGYTVRLGYPRSQLFSSGGCPGVNETSAAAAVGMILEAKRDPRLNCVEEAPSERKAEEEQQAEQETVRNQASAEEASNQDGTLFGESEDELIVPNKKKKKKEQVKITWIRKMGKKISNSLEGAFDSTVGELFDKMDEDNREDYDRTDN